MRQRLKGIDAVRGDESRPEAAIHPNIPSLANEDPPVACALRLDNHYRATTVSTVDLYSLDNGL